MHTAPPANTATPGTCAECGGAIAANAALGQCPRCLLELGLTCEREGPDDLPTPFNIVEVPQDFDYDLLEQIGRGGMGLVYRARQKSLNRIVALKVMAAGEFASPASLARFRHEAKTAAKLDHPNIVTIIEVGETHATPYLVMRLVEGASLAQRIKSYALPEQAQQLGAHKAQVRIAKLIGSVARAVDYAHRRGVLHRDLKPSNILLDADANPHLTDFGIAKSLEDEGGITETSELLGTLNYMAPEQAAGKRISKGADVYSLGAILYELLTGQPPFYGTKMETLRQVLEEEPPKPCLLNPLIERDLETICAKCLDKHPDRRYSTASEMADDLDRWLRHEPILARQAGPLLRLQRWTYRNPAVATLIASLSAGIAISMVLLARANEEQTRKSIALDILRTESARQLQEIWSSGASSFRIKSETLAAMAGMEVTALTDLEDRFAVGLVSEGNPLDRVLRAAPVLHNLERSMSLRYATPVRVDLALFKQPAGAIDELVGNQVEFAQLNAREFLRARNLSPGVQPVVAILPAANDSRAVIFTRQETGIRTLEDLRGKSLLLGTANSTMSFWAKVNLVGADVRSSNLARFRYVDQTHDVLADRRVEKSVALGNPFSAMTPVEAVLAGFYHAAVVSEKRFREVAAEQHLVALARFQDSRDLLVASADLPVSTVEHFREALLSLGDAALEHEIFNAPVAFRAASEEDFREVESRLAAEAAFER